MTEDIDQLTNKHLLIIHAAIDSFLNDCEKNNIPSNVGYSRLVSLLLPFIGFIYSEKMQEESRESFLQYINETIKSVPETLNKEK